MHPVTKRFLIIGIVSAALLFGQQSAMHTFSGTVAAQPVSCTSPGFYWATDPTDGTNLRICSGGVYVALGSGGGGGGNANGLTVYSGLAGVGLSSATLFFPIGGGSLASTTETNVQSNVQAATTFQNFGALISTALGQTIMVDNSVTFTFRKNASDQTLTCTITNPSLTCADTAHSFTVAAGDVVAIKAVFTGTISATPIFTFATQAGVNVTGPTGPAGGTGPAGATGATGPAGGGGGTFTPPYVTPDNTSFYGPIFSLTQPGAQTGQATTLNGGVNNSTTTWTVASSSGFPAVPFIAQSGTENVKVTNVSSVTWTVARGYDGTSAASHSNGDAVTLQNWQWINQGSATSSGSNGALTITAPATASESMKILKQIAPATPYTKIGRVLFGGFLVDNARCGVIFRQSSTGKIIPFQISSFTSLWKVFVDKFTDATTYSGSSYVSGWPSPGQWFDTFFRIQDDGVNLIFSLSPDKVNWTTVTTQSRTDFMTSTGPDEIGFITEPLNATYPTTCTLIDWT